MDSDTKALPGYCRIVNGKPCECLVAWALKDGTCPCAPGNKSNPIVPREANDA